jgi:hypothetical protein
MNLKRTLFTGLAAAGLMASFAVPVAIAQTAPPAEVSTTNNTTVAYVQVATDGEFDVYFGSGTFNLGSETLNANNPEGLVSGTMRVLYVDTMAYRPQFDVTMTAGDFDNINSPNLAHIIDAENFQVTYAYNVQQAYWSGNAPDGADIGDIGYYVDGHYVGQNNAGQAWTGTTNLGEGPTVQFGYSGSGTSSSYGDLGVSLTIPNTTVAGQYNSAVTLTVIAGLQP